MKMTIRVDAAFFLGGISKDQILKAFKAQIFFDDQEVHLGLASAIVPSGLVPYRSDSILTQ
ncbi:5'-nucleotidase [Pleurocapsa sp. CCALA 161]|uniref:5'-nucleotidase n=1 Tax=Pleurocapsa sp. CCALA 161 TaxID=2107688 RepID=UPI002100DF95|nr:5'-nucleotidase [Pleurocapsa sp. CCALA 161]